MNKYLNSNRTRTKVPWASKTTKSNELSLENTLFFNTK